MREKFNQLIESCGTRTVPAAETKSIGLAAYAQVSWFLLSHLDSFIMTRQLSSIYRDLVPSRQIILTKNLSPLTRTGKKRGTATLTPTNQTAGPSDCLITKMKSLRIEYLKFFVYRYPIKKLYKLGY
jgi:hypothetical protein